MHSRKSKMIARFLSSAVKFDSSRIHNVNMSRRRQLGKLASCTVDFVSREFPFPTIQPTTSPRHRRELLSPAGSIGARFVFSLIPPQII